MFVRIYEDPLNSFLVFLSRNAASTQDGWRVEPTADKGRKEETEKLEKIEISSRFSFVRHNDASDIELRWYFFHLSELHKRECRLGEKKRGIHTQKTGYDRDDSQVWRRFIRYRAQQSHPKVSQDHHHHITQSFRQQLFKRWRRQRCQAGLCDNVREEDEWINRRKHFRKIPPKNGLTLNQFRKIF